MEREQATPKKYDPSAFYEEDDECEDCIDYCDDCDDDDTVSGKSNKEQSMKEEDDETTGVWRGTAFLFLLFAGVALAVGTYVLVDKTENRVLVNSFQYLSAAIETQVKEQSENVLSALDHLGHQLTTQSLLSSKNTTSGASPPPFITLPYFNVAGGDAKMESRDSLTAISYVPYITDQERKNWLAYSVQHGAEWWVADAQQSTIASTITPFFFTRSSANLVAYNGSPAPAFPLWLTSPSPTNVTAVVNFDAASLPFFTPLYKIMTAVNGAALSAVGNSSLIWGDNTLASNVRNSLVNNSVILYPVHSSLSNNNMPNSSTILGALVGSVNWEVFTAAVRQGSADAFDKSENYKLVLSNTCGQNSVYDSKHTTINFVDNNATMQSLFRATSPQSQKVLPIFGANLGLGNNSNTSGSTCDYYFTLYGSMETHSLRPAVFSTCVFLLFLIMSVTFVVYHGAVQRRIRQAVVEAERSNALVTSLFPTSVHDRLFGTQGDSDEEDDESHTRRSVRGKKLSKLRKSAEQKADLSNNLFDDSESEEMQDDDIMYKTKPIADLFPSVTILFSDISGFTAWSSAREPTEVFILLETLYRAFDIIAKKRKVFKVETVGDCYVAVTGLPEPMMDHAVTMVRFARECMRRTRELVKKLEVTLGPDTSQLCMRMGIHSGPITGGVIRGDKSRFQLFGDTMNTASRTETTGLGNRIQISQETADLVAQAGKADWFYPREEKVFAKGKGEMQCFWVKLGRPRTAKKHSVRDLASKKEDDDDDDDSEDGSESDFSDSDASEFVNDKLIQSLMAPKTARLVEFNVEILVRLLKRIVRRRNALNESNNKPQRLSAFAPLSSKEDADSSVGAEIRDGIEIQKFEPGAAFAPTDEADDVYLDPEVVKQLNDFVANVAIMYHDTNAYHNFEHASHVMMAVTKLLSRMVGATADTNKSSDEVALASALHSHTFGIASDPVSQFACAFSALVHNLDHPGVTNSQLAREKSNMAVLYKNRSIAEQNSIDLAMGLLMDENYPDLRNVLFTTQEELGRFRSLVVNCVLSTDLMDSKLQAARNQRWMASFHNNSHGSEKDDKEAVDRKATLVLEHVLQASVLSHTMQHWHMYRKWNDRLFVEMKKAYDNRRAVADPTDYWYLSEIDFFDSTVIPLATKLRDCGILGVAGEENLSYALNNKKEWVARGKDIIQEMAAERRAGKSQKSAPKNAESISSLMMQVQDMEAKEERILQQQTEK